MMSRRALLLASGGAIAVVLLLAFLAIGANRTPGSTPSSPLREPSLESTATVGEDGSSEDTSAPVPPTADDITSDPADDSGLTNSEAADLEAQLDAIERELNSIALPGDSDFTGIEDEIR